jgi:hypothetical protein
MFHNFQAWIKSNSLLNLEKLLCDYKVIGMFYFKNMILASPPYDFRHAYV